MPWPDWLAVERASWVVTIVALVAGLVQVFLVLRELRKKAQIKMGLIMPDVARRPENFSTQRTVVAPWPASGASESDPIKIPFGIANTGDRTAENLYHELVFPSNVYRIRTAEAEAGMSRDGSGQVHIVWGPDSLHPRSGLTHYVFLTVPQETTDATVESTAVFRDSTVLKTTLKLEFQARTARGYGMR
jgi:hypothetical protein